MQVNYQRLKPRATPGLRLFTAIASIVLALVGGFAPTGATTAAARLSGPATVATRLDNPRGLVALDDHTLAVAEAGHAGPVCLGSGLCVGLSGKVTILGTNGPDRAVVASGLPSFSGPFGAFGLGGVTLQNGQIYFVNGLNPQYYQSFGNPTDACRGQTDYSTCVNILNTFIRQAGYLSKVKSLDSNRGWSNIVNVGRFDYDYAVAHPDPGNLDYAPGDANPFGVLPGPSGGIYVVDAASNTLDFVSRGGNPQVVVAVPDPASHLPTWDAVPTCAARTPQGDLYMGTKSNELWRWDGNSLTQVLKGNSKLGQIVGCAADRDGNIYLANLTSEIGGTYPNFVETPFDGSIVKVTPQLKTSYVATKLNYPTGLALGQDGSLYVSLNGLCPSDLSLLDDTNSIPGGCPEPGKIVRFDLP